MTASPRPSAAVQSVGRALDVLEVLARSNCLGLTEIAASTGLRPSTAHRLLATLISRGYVRQQPRTKRYQLGYGAALLTAGMGRLDQRLRLAAQNQMRRVHQVCGETVNLLVLDGDHAVYADQIAGTGALRMFTEPGARVPAHASGGGKAMLAQLEPDAVEALLEPPLAAFTANTITELGRMRAELDQVREAGFALDREEYEVAVSCVGAPVLWPDGAVAGALSVSGPSSRLWAVADADAFGELLARSALEVSRALGYRQPSRFDAEPVLAR